MQKEQKSPYKKTWFSKLYSTPKHKTEMASEATKMILRTKQLSTLASSHGRRQHFQIEFSTQCSGTHHLAAKAWSAKDHFSFRCGSFQPSVLCSSQSNSSLTRTRPCFHTRRPTHEDSEACYFSWIWIQSSRTNKSQILGSKNVLHIKVYSW